MRDDPNNVALLLRRVQMKLNHNKFNDVLVFVLLLVREENRRKVDTTLLPRELLQSKNGSPLSVHAYAFLYSSG